MPHDKLTLFFKSKTVTPKKLNPFKHQIRLNLKLFFKTYNRKMGKIKTVSISATQNQCFSSIFDFYQTYKSMIYYIK